MKINLELAEDEAAALARYVRQLTWTELRGFAVDEMEACHLRDAFERLRRALECTQRDEYRREDFPQGLHRAVCEVCGGPAPASERCTNMRCADCHRDHCSKGGATEPGHGRGTVATPFARRS